MARSDSADVDQSVSSQTVLAAIQLGWALEAWAALPDVQLADPASVGRSVAILSGPALEGLVRSMAVDLFVKKLNLVSFSKTLSTPDKFDAWSVETLQNLEDHAVLTAYELGKALGRTCWQISAKQAMYAQAPSLATARAARGTWHAFLGWPRMQLIRTSLWLLRGFLEPGAVTQTLASLRTWKENIGDPSDTRRLGRLGWWPFGKGARLGLTFTPERAVRLAALLTADLEQCCMRLVAPASSGGELSPSGADSLTVAGGDAQALPPPGWSETVTFDAPLAPAARSGPTLVTTVRQHCVGALLAASPVAPVVAAVASVALYLTGVTVAVPFMGGVIAMDGTQPLLGGGAALLGAWAVLAVLIVVLGFTSPDRASMGTYAELTSQLPELEEWARAAPQLRAGNDPLKQVRARELVQQLSAIHREQPMKGPRWILGTGYLTLWQRLHRAQEALIDIEPDAGVIEHAQYDLVRMRSSTIESSQTYVGLLAAAIDMLSTPAPDVRVAHLSETLTAALDQVESRESTNRWRFWTWRPWIGARLARDLAPLKDELAGMVAGHNQQTPMPGATNAIAAASAPLVPTAGLRAPRSRDEARGLVRTIRRVINEFRDDRRAGLIRARNQLSLTVGITGITAYAVLWLALAGLAFAFPPSSQHQPAQAVAYVEAGLAFYLVAAIVGLFSRLYTEANTEGGVDDFGLSLTRLIAAPLLSGVAGVLGVVIVAAATAVQGVHTGVASSPLAIALAAASSPLAIAFDLNQSPTNIVTAGIFGLTPGLLISRLTQAGEGYKQDLKSSESPGRSAS